MHVENPMINWKEEEPPRYYGTDFLGNEVYVGDEIFVIDDVFFLKDELSFDAIQILRHFGASEEIAERRRDE